VKTEVVTRMVGYLEYGRALALLDGLVRRATPEELKVIDEFIASRPEYTVYTNLSRKWENQPSSLSEAATPGDSFARQGLPWVMALARVELGALVAGFTERARPFAVLPPTAYEYQAFRSMMLDSLRSHYHALRQDPVAQAYFAYRLDHSKTSDVRQGKSGVNEQQAIAYARRVAITREFLSAVRELGASDLSPSQQVELAQWEAQLNELLSTILVKVLGLGYASEVVVQSGTSTNWQACGRLLQIAQQELQSGKATVTRTQVK
jgi:hypothetical protein